jgi:hypothetical protein
MGKYGEKKNKYDQGYHAANYDRVYLVIRKDRKPGKTEITEAAEKAGMSFTEWIMQAVQEKLEKDKSIKG